MVEHRLRGESLWLSIVSEESRYGYHPFGILLVPPGPRAWPDHVYIGGVERYGEREGGGGEGGESYLFGAPPFLNLVPQRLTTK